MAYDVATPQNMGRGELALTAGILHTVAAKQRDMLKDIDISNTNASPARVTVYLVPSGGSPGDANTLIPNIEVPGYGIFQWSGSQVIEEGDTIQAVSNVIDVSINMSGGGFI